jgi:hypothetical protein
MTLPSDCSYRCCTNEMTLRETRLAAILNGVQLQSLPVSMHNRLPAFPSTALPHQCSYFPWRNFQRHSVQDTPLWSSRIVHVDSFKNNLPTRSVGFKACDASCCSLPYLNAKDRTYRRNARRVFRHNGGSFQSRFPIHELEDYRVKEGVLKGISTGTQCYSFMTFFHLPLSAAPTACESDEKM